MVAISAMNGLSVAGMAIGASIALPEMLKRGYDKRSHEQARQQQARENAGQPQLADRLPGDHPIENENHARRNHNP